MTEGETGPRALGPYELLCELGRGGQGVVFEARRPGIDQRLAIKVLVSGSPTDAKRFEQEGRVLARLEHPNLPKIVDLGAENGRPYLAMEFLDGQNLWELVEIHGPFDVDRAVEIMGTVAQALDYCHARGVVHRDVKPANVLVEARTGRVVLLDFGLLKRDPEAFGALSSEERQSRLTRSTDLVGTPAYMAPEQSDASFGTVGPRSDVYALGATLYALLTGTAPFSGKSTINVLLKVLEAPAPDPRVARPETPRALAELCVRAMSKDPAGRPESAQAFAAELEGAASAVPSPRRRSHVLGYAALALATGLGAVALVVLGPDPVESPPVESAGPGDDTVKSAPEALTPNPRVAEPRLGEFEDALAECDRVIELNPRDPRAYSRRAAVREAAGDFVGAIADHTGAITLAPRDPSGYFGRGEARRKHGDLRGAVRDFETTLALAPEHTQRDALRAFVREQVGNPEVTERTRHFVQSGTAMLAERRYREALVQFSRALEVDPSYSLAYLARGKAKEGLKDRRGMIDDYSRAIALDATSWEALVDRAAARLRLGDMKGARQDYTRAVEINPCCSVALFGRGNVKYAAQDWPGAIDDYTLALRLNPVYTKAFLGRGNARLAAGDQRGAEADFTQATAIDPKYALAHNGLGVVRRARGDLEGAIEAYTRAIEHGSRSVGFFINRGIAKREFGDRQGAIEDFDRAIGLDPKSASAYANRGATNRLHDVEGAIEDYTQAIALEPKIASLYMDRGVIKGASRDLRGAVDDLERAIELLDPSSPKVAICRSQILKHKQAARAE